MTGNVSRNFTVEDLEIATIKVGDRRNINPEKVEAMKGSITELGLQQPVAVTKDRKLIFGRHRFEACKRLGWPRIPARVLDLDDVRVQMAEIDENLMRSNLSASEEAAAVVKRKRLYEQLHPETKHGGSHQTNGDGSSGKVCHLESFASNTAKQTGRSDRSIRQSATIGKRIPEALLKRLGSTAIADNKSQLEKLGRLGEKDQHAVVGLLEEGAASVAEAIRKAKAPWSPEMRAAVIEKRALDDLNKATNYDLAEKDSELRQLAELPGERQRAVAALIRKDEVRSVPEAIEQINSAEDSDATANDTLSDPPELPPSMDVEPDDSWSVEDVICEWGPERTYRFVREAGRYLLDHFDEVVGQSGDVEEGARLKELYEFTELAVAAEQDAADETDAVLA